VTRVLQTTGDESSLSPLHEALTEPDAAVRGNIAEALAKIGGVSELPALADLLKHDKDEGVRARVASALGELGDARARPALEDSARTDPDSVVRATAAAALAKLR
jgi:HEAT repeat protein